MGKTWCIDPINGSNTETSGDSWSVDASGTDGVTNGTTTFTTATGGLTGMTGRCIRIDTALRVIVSVESDTSCTLDSTYSAGSGRSWWIGGAALTHMGLPYSTFIQGEDNVVKYAKTGGWESAGTITYTSKSDEVVVGSGRVALIDDCESAWTGAANVTVSQETNTAYKKFGSYALKLVVASGFTTGKLAYFDFGAGNEKDLSAFQGASLLYKSPSNVPAGMLQLCLCSDATGDTVVDTIDLMPGSSNLYSNAMYPLRGFKTGGGNLGSSIRSVALYAAVDPGTPTLYFDNIYAMLAEASANHICHNCLIGQGNTISDLMWAVLGFTDETHVKLLGEWYGGTPGAVASYRVEPAHLWGAPVTALGCYSTPTPQYGDEVINSGGWDTSTDTQNGVTCIRLLPSHSSYDRWLNPSSYDHYALERFIFTQGFRPTKYKDCLRLKDCGFVGTTDQADTGLQSSSTNTADASMWRLDFDNVWVTAMASYGISATTSGTTATYSDAFLDFTWKDVTVYSTGGVRTKDMKRFRGKNLKFCNNNSGELTAWRISSAVLDMDIVGLTLKDNEASSYAALHCDCATGRIRIWDLVASDNDNATFNTSNVEIICYNPNSTDAVLYKTDDFLAHGKVAMLKQGGDATDHLIYTYLGTIASELSVRHTAADIAWKFSPTHAAGLPMRHKLAEVALEAGVAATIGVYMRRDSTDAHGRLVIPGGWLLGMPEADYTDDLEAAANVWELVSVSLTPTETGVVEVWVEAWGGTSNNLYVDDLSVTV